MDIRNRRALKETAGARLAAADYDPRRLALIHTGVAAAAGLMIVLMDFVVNHYMENTGGLSGIGMRSVLETIQATLQYIRNLAAPFWQFGFVYAMLQISRGEQARPKSLLEGFRQFGAVLRLRLSQGMIYLGIMVGGLYLCSYLFVMTPYAQPMMEMLEPMVSENVTMEQLEAAVLQMPMEQLMQVAMPFFIMFGILALLVGLFLFYCFRMADYIVLEQPRITAVRAMFFSTRMTKKNRFALLRLDLSFWWFYGLSAVCILLGYLDYLLPLVGVTLPVSADAAWLLCYILGLLAQLALYWYAYSYVQTTYACAYDVLRQQLEETMPPMVPQNLPWEEYKTEE